MQNCVKTKITMKDLGYRLPLDLIIEILRRLPAKSVFRFRCVSKSWYSIMSSQQFINSFMSLSQPRLVLIFTDYDNDKNMFFISAHQSCSFMSSSSMAVFPMPALALEARCGYISHNSVRGFICCCLQDCWFVVCNPSTGQIIRLAKRKDINYDDCKIYLGYDPNNDQYKVLRLTAPKPGLPIEHRVLTLGGQVSSHSWRPIKANIPECYGFSDSVYIDGVVYHDQYMINDNKTVVTSFDVGSEQLSLIATHEDFGVEHESYLTNYLGKLAIHCYRDNGFILWVLDDVKNQVWSKKTRVVPSLLKMEPSFAGITAGGEIVYVPQWYLEPFELLFYDVEKKMERRVRVEGLSGVKSTPGQRPFCSLLCSYVDNITYFSGGN